MLSPSGTAGRLRGEGDRLGGDLRLREAEARAGGGDGDKEGEGWPPGGGVGMRTADWMCAMIQKWEYLSDQNIVKVEKRSLGIAEE